MKNANSLPDIQRPTLREFALNRQLLSDMIFDRVINAVEIYCSKNGLKRKDLAEIMNRNQSKVTRWLNSPNNWELFTVADLLTAVGMRGVDLQLEEICDDIPRSNHRHDFLIELENSQMPKILESRGFDFKLKTPMRQDRPRELGMQFKNKPLASV